MKEFNLELAKSGAKLITRKGLPARIVCYDRVDEKYHAPILALILGKNKKWEASCFPIFLINHQDNHMNLRYPNPILLYHHKLLLHHKMLHHKYNQHHI